MRHTCKFGLTIRLTFLEANSRVLRAKNRFCKIFDKLKIRTYTFKLRIKKTKKMIIIIRFITFTPGGCLFAFHICLRDEKGMTIR